MVPCMRVGPLQYSIGRSCAGAATSGSERTSSSHAGMTQAVAIGHVLGAARQRGCARARDRDRARNECRSMTNSLVATTRPSGVAAVAPQNGIEAVAALAVDVQPDAHLHAVVEMDLAPLVAVAAVAASRCGCRDGAASTAGRSSRESPSTSSRTSPHSRRAAEAHVALEVRVRAVLAHAGLHAAVPASRRPASAACACRASARGAMRRPSGSRPTRLSA